MLAILATGASLTPAMVSAVRNLPAIAVSNAYLLAPWAQALVSSDAAWWAHYRPEFAGRRFSVARVRGCELIGANPGWNSGACAVRVARCIFGAKQIILLGFDGHGGHFFGEHPEREFDSDGQRHQLRNTNTERRRMHMAQHRIEAAACASEGVEVWNCSPGTVIAAYPTACLKDLLPC